MLSERNLRPAMQPKLEVSKPGQNSDLEFTLELEILPDITIPELGKGMLEAINLGVPAVRRVPGLRRALAPLVRELTGISPATASQSWLRKLFRR